MERYLLTTPRTRFPRCTPLSEQDLSRPPKPSGDDSPLVGATNLEFRRLRGRPGRSIATGSGRRTGRPGQGEASRWWAAPSRAADFGVCRFEGRVASRSYPSSYPSLPRGYRWNPANGSARFRNRAGRPDAYSAATSAITYQLSPQSLVRSRSNRPDGLRLRSVLLA